MDNILVGRTKRWGGVHVFCIFGSGDIECFDMGVGLVLGFPGALVVETLEGICNISRHREFEFRVGVVPIQIQSKVAFALPITGDEIVLLEDSHEMFGMLFADVFCTKVVYTKS